MPPVIPTLMTAAAGAGIAWALGVPAPFLTGPALFVSVASVLGLRAALPDRLRDACFVVIGIGMGTGVTPEAVAAAARWPLSLVALSLALIVILLVGTRLLMAGFGFDRLTAFLATSPGHLSFVLGLSADLPVNLRQIAIVQSLRVLALTLIVPMLVAWLTDAEMILLQPGTRVMGLAVLAALLVLSAVVGLGMKRLRVPAAYLLAGMAVSATGHLTQMAPGAVPPWLSVPAFIVMGALIGSRFAGTSAAELRHAAGAALALTTFAALVSLAAAAAVSHFLGIPLVTVLIAFAPGGVETMAAMSIMLDADPAFVATHHVFRIVMLSFLVPLFLPRTPRATRP